MSARTWQAARPYVVAPAALGATMLLARWRRSGLTLLGMAAGVALFFRDPERHLDADAEVVYSAADGIVRAVDSGVSEPELPGADAVRISTFLSVFDVHVNRSPLPGRVVDVQELGGGFAPAFLKRSEHNLRHQLTLQTELGPAVVVLMAGLLARRISRWVEVGDDVLAGQRIALIHFGSRTDVLLPADRVDVLVSAGDRVRAGVTPLARYHAPSPAAVPHELAAVPA